MEETVKKLQVTSIPALFWLYQWEIVGNKVGMMSDVEIERTITDLEKLVEAKT